MAFDPDAYLAGQGGGQEQPDSAARITFYTAHEDQYGQKTAARGPDGQRLAHEGVTIAVDPAVIPYGSRVRIPGLAHLSAGGDGVFVAHDTGTAVKSRQASRGKEPVIDVFLAGGASESKARMQELAGKVGPKPLAYEVLDQQITPANHTTAEAAAQRFAATGAGWQEGVNALTAQGWSAEKAGSFLRKRAGELRPFNIDRDVPLPANPSASSSAGLFPDDAGFDPDQYLAAKAATFDPDAYLRAAPVEVTRESVAAERNARGQESLADKADKLATGLGKGIRGVVETGSNALSEIAADPLGAVQALPSTVLEGATRGTFDLVDMGRRIQNNDALQRARAIASPTALADPTVRSAFANALLPPAQQTDLDFQRALENQAWENTRRAGLDEQGNLLPQGFRDALGAPLPATSEALSLVLDPTLALPGIGQGTKFANVGRRSLATGLRPVATATEAAGSAVTSGMTRAGGALMQGIESTGIDPTIARAGAGVVGAGSLLTAPGQFIAGTGAAAKGAEMSAQALGAVADTALSGRSQFSASARIAADPAKPMWLRKSASVISRLPDAPFAVAGAGFEGTLQGSALGGALALASGEDAEGIGEAIGSGGPLGAVGAGAGRMLPSNRRAQRQFAEDGDILWALSRQEEQGGAVDHLARLPRQELLKVATLQRVFADTTDVLFVPQAKFSELVPNAAAAGAYVHSSPEGRPQILVNVDARQSTGRTLFHETSHALMRSPAINKDEARLALAEAYPVDRLDAMGLEYARRQLEAERASLPPPLPAPPAPAVSPGFAAELGFGATPPPLPARDERIVTGALARQRFEQLTADAVAAGDLDGRDWIRDEVLAEHFAAELDGRPWNLDDIRRGAAPGTNLGKVREAWLEAKGRFLSALGVPFDQTGKLAKPLSEVFRDNPLTRDPAMQKLVIGQLRQRTNWLSALHRVNEKEDTLLGAPLVTAKGLQALANSPAIQWRPRPDGSAETDFAVRTRDGRVVIKGVDEIRETERLRTAQSRMIVPSQAVPAGSPQFGRKTVDGRQVIAGHTLPPQFDMLNHFGPEARVAARAMEAARANGGTFDLWYHQIGSGGDQAWSSAVRKGLGNVAATQRELSLVGWEQSKAGNIYGRLLDVGAARARAFELQNAGRLELWGGDVNGFQRDVQTYLANHAAGRDGHAGIGEGKRDFINGFFGVATKANKAANPVWSGKFGRSLIKSFRLDRMQNVRPTARQGWAVTYERMKANLLPDVPATEGPPAPRAPGSEPAAGPGVEAIAADVSSMVKGWGSNPQIRVFQDLSEIPESQIRDRAMGAKGKVEAFHRFIPDGKGGKRSQVTLIAGNISSVQRARELISHEVIGHASMQALFRGRLKDRYDGIVEGAWRRFERSKFDEVWAKKQGYRTLHELADRYGFSTETKIGRAQIIEEHLARMAELDKRPSWVQAVVAQIRDLLRQVSTFFKTYTDSDILALLQQARARAKDWLGDGYN